MKCKCCEKPLSKEKGEIENGCLDCAGYIYMIDDEYICIRCLKNIAKDGVKIILKVLTHQKVQSSEVHKYIKKVNRIIGEVKV